MASITGQILMPDGVSPKPGVVVAIVTGTAPHHDMAAETDEQGVYRLSGLEAGTYVVRADTAQCAVTVEADNVEVHCDLKVEPKAKRTATRSSREGKTSGKGKAGDKEVSPYRSNGGTTKGEEGAPEELPAHCSPPPEVDVEGPESTELVEVEETFGSDPYDRDIDPTETTEAGPVSISHVDRGLVYAILSIEIARGVQDVDKLTDKAWQTLNPAADFPISTGDPDYKRKSAEWLFLRNEIVLPLIKPKNTGPKRKPGGVGPLSLVSARMPKGPTHRLSANQLKFGLPETIEALTEIAEEWHRRHPKVVLMIRDISREGGGRITPPHGAHSCGLEPDCQLWVGKHKVCMKNPRYPEWRPLMQEFVDLVWANRVLPVKAIGFSDRKIRNVSHWSGHTCHAHIRFCAPPSKIDQIERFIDQEYADRPRWKRPKYRCKAG